MKSVLLFVVMVMAACQHTGHPPAEDTGQEEENVPLTLNHGNKWKVDSITADHVAKLKRITADPGSTPPSAGNYRALGSDLISEVNRMLADCKMTGPAHEALHQWLHPVIRAAAEIKKTTDTAVARPVLDTLRQQIDEYNHYFE